MGNAAVMVCTNCGEQGHNIKSCPKLQGAEADNSKRGQRESPRTPSEAAKFAKLENISKNLSPQCQVSLLPHDAASSASQSDPYLDGIQKLSAKMDTLASKADVETMHLAVIAETKTLISDAVDPIKDEFSTLHVRVATLEQQRGEASGIALARKVEDIEA